MSQVKVSIPNMGKVDMKLIETIIVPQSKVSIPNMGKVGKLISHVMTSAKYQFPIWVR